MPGAGAAPPGSAVLPVRPGVYRFRDARGRALYVGRATDLRSRVRSYWGDLRGRRHLARMVARIDMIEAVVCGSRHEAGWLERSMLEHRLPPWNRTAGGQEVPVWLRVTDQGVSVEHDGARPGVRFGPYLGGAQTRCAAAGLERIYPFRYATPVTGAARDLARIRGVLPADGPRMRTLVVAVLSGDPHARDSARAELTRRRQAAADRLDFERAATIQREIEGLDWITQPCRVLDGGPDMDIHGWAGGVLVTFELRDGRVRDWRAETCPEPDAEARLLTTPTHWRDFAAENAALAATLRAAR